MRLLHIVRYRRSTFLGCRPPRLRPLNGTHLVRTIVGGHRVDRTGKAARLRNQPKLCRKVKVIGQLRWNCRESRHPFVAVSVVGLLR